jgi:hypothetical protein
MIYFSKRLKSPSIIYILNGFLFLLSVSVLWLGFFQKEMWIILFGAFLTGCADCFCFAMALAIAGRWNTSGISLFNFAQSFTVALMSTINIFISLPYLLIIYSVVQLLSTAILLNYRETLN